MPDPYRIPDPSSRPAPPTHAADAGDAGRPGARGGALRPVLWIVLVISLAANVVTSTAGLIAVSAAFGLIVVACAATLIAHHYRLRRRG